MKKSKKTKRLEAHIKPKIALVILSIMIFIFFLSSVSALSIKEKTNDKKYNDLEIEDGIIIKNKVADIELVSNDDYCLIDCEAIIKIDLQTNAKLIKLFDFKDNKGNKKNLPYTVSVLKNGTYQIPHYDSEQVFLTEEEYGYGKIYDKENKSYSYNVNQETGEVTFFYLKKIENGTETKEYRYWDTTTISNTFSKGTYYVKIEAKKKPTESIDWAFTYEDIKSDDVRKHWAWWDGSWTKRRQVTIDGDTEDINNYPILLNITYDSDMNSTFKDLRFVDGACSGAQTDELPYEIDHYTTSNNAKVWVNIPTLSAGAGNTDICMYYGNPSAESGENSPELWKEFTLVYHMTENSGTLIDSSSSSANSTAGRGNPIEAQNGIVGNFSYFDGDDHYITGSGDVPQSASTYLEVWAFTNLSSLSYNKWVTQFNYNSDTGTATAGILQLNAGDDLGLSHAYRISGEETQASGISWTQHTWMKIDQWVTNGVQEIYVDKVAGTRHTTSGGDIAYGANPTEFIIGEWSAFSANYAWQGGIDEVRISNVSRSSSWRNRTYDITDFTKISFGSEELPSGITVVFNEPQDGENISTATPDLSCNYTANDATDNISTVTLYVYDSGTTLDYNYTEYGINTVSYNKTWTTSTLTDDTYNWQCWGQSTSGSNATETTNRTFILDATAPTLTSPDNQSSFLVDSFPYNWTLQYNSTDSHQGACWYSYTDNMNNVTITCNASTILNFTSSGVKYIYYYANDTFGNLANGTASITLSQIIENASYADPVNEQTSTHLSVMLNSTDAITQFNGTLYYDSVAQTTSYSNTTNYGFLNTTLNTPTVTNDTDILFYWDYWLNNVNYNTATYNHTVQNAEVGVSANCSAGLDAALIFSFHDEKNDSSLTTDIRYNFQYGATTPYDTSQNGNLSDVSEFSLCINSSVSPNYTLGVGELEYELTGFGARTYYLRNASISNETQNISLYLLSSDYDEKFTVDTHYGNDLVIDGRVLIQKYFIENATYKTVGIRITDDLGRFVEYLELDKEYRFLVLDVEENLLGTEEKVAICGTTPCTSSIFLSSGEDNPFSGYDNIYAGQVFYNVTYNHTTQIMTLDFFDVTGLASEVTFLVTNDFINSESVILCNNVTSSTSGLLTCNTTGHNGTISWKATISRSPYKVFGFGDVFKEFVTERLGQFGIIMAIILIITVFFAFIIDLSLAIMSIPLIMTLLKLINLVPISWTSISVFWILALGIAYFINR